MLLTPKLGKYVAFLNKFEELQASILSLKLLVGKLHWGYRRLLGLDVSAAA